MEIQEIQSKICDGFCKYSGNAEQCQNCPLDELNTVASELQQYRSIGTVKENNKKNKLKKAAAEKGERGMNVSDIQGFILYRIYYGNVLIYLGRTKQPLQNRIRGHLFKKAMHRSINIDLVTKIEYAIFKTGADMNLYEIYFINLWKPPLNIDDKCNDELTVSLPDVDWKLFETHLWDKWKEEIHKKDNAYRMRENEKSARQELLRVMRKQWHDGEISEEAYYAFKESETNY